MASSGSDECGYSEQGDPATTDDAMLARLEVFGPGKLYFNWEKGHWSVGALDFAQDRQDWANLREEQRSLVIGALAPFFAGEERVANTFGPILMSATDDAELAFLATQQVDEARHMQFCDRSWREVFMTHAKHRPTALQDAEERCNTAFTQLFDQRLKDTVERLRRSPGDVEARIEAITIYHLIVEGVLAVTAMRFVLDYLEKRSILPAVTQGLQNTKRDEHRHIAFGTWYLRQKCREQERYAFLVQKTLMELMPVAAAIVIPGGTGACDGLDPLEFLDYPSALVSHYALTALSRRLKVIGGATQEIQQFVASGAWRAARMLEAQTGISTHTVESSIASPRRSV
jgi:ribonucleoside-diphosphate reductase beta chain